MQSLGAGDGNCFITDQNSDMPWERNRICGSILEKQGIQNMEGKAEDAEKYVIR